MKIDTELTQPKTESSVASANGFSHQIEVSVTTNGGKKISWIWMYFFRLRGEGKFARKVLKLRGGSAICGATYV